MVKQMNIEESRNCSKVGALAKECPHEKLFERIVRMNRKHLFIKGLFSGEVLEAEPSL